MERVVMGFMGMGCGAGETFVGEVEELTGGWREF